jgi:DNA-binding transcriptional MerR regulator
MKDLYTVQEFSKLSGVEASKLRFYDDIGLFSPIRRDPVNNYRYYSLVQLLTINFISVLSDLGLPLKLIGELKKDREPEELLSLLEKRELQLDMELRTLRLRSSVIHARQELIRCGLKADIDEISVVSMEEKAMIIWPRNEYEDGDSFIEPLASFVHQADEQRIDLNFPVGGYWDNFDAFRNEPSRPDHFFSLDPTGNKTWEAGKYLTGFSEGYYGEFGDLADRMEAYIIENKLKIKGPVYNIYLLDEVCMTEPDKYLSLVCVAVC